ncbi:transposase [Pontibacter ummariensis]|uniref:Transposase n=1 Tax=Pontibacter ummariensis TaxID=1610492 RepID=A0A239IUC6_9BACT|nr:transposase [Pontibacter ummariensis]PRY08972.1 transposase [Pontibacter ummariensis]SNS97386.1 Transposase [Pontibacter ummariensis]
MQGRKTFEDERELRFSLSAHVPGHNFYRRLKDRLDLNFLYELTAPYYGRCGQQSIDPVVFFKFCLVSYLENIDSDRRLIEHCSLRLDLLYFLDYQLDEPLPWHSTVSRNRQLLPTSVFEEAFTRVLSMCVESGMASGHTQVVDSALIKANASMGLLELKVPTEQLEARLQQVRTFSSADRRAMREKARPEQRTLTASQQQLHGLRTLHHKWHAEQNLRPVGSNKGAKYTSNKTHYSPVDPDARIAVNPGKSRKLCYHMQLSVDASRHVITHVMADHADRKDSRCLPDLLVGLTRRFYRLGLRCTSLLADTGYSSGQNYALLEREGIAAFIPPNGKYRGAPEGFTYEKEGDFFLCPVGKKAIFCQQISKTKGGQAQYRLYRTSRQDCRDCPLTPAAGHGGAGAGDAVKPHGYAKGQHPRAGASPQWDAGGRRCLQPAKIAVLYPKKKPDSRHGAAQVRAGELFLLLFLVKPGGSHGKRNRNQKVHECCATGTQFRLHSRHWRTGRNCSYYPGLSCSFPLGTCIPFH